MRNLIVWAIDVVAAAVDRALDIDWDFWDDDDA